MPKSKFNKNEKAFIYHMETNKFFDFLKTDNAKNCLIFILKKIIIVNYLLKNKEEVGKDMFDIDNMFDWINLSQLKQKNILEILDELNILINNEKNEKIIQAQNMEEKPKSPISQEERVEECMNYGSKMRGPSKLRGPIMNRRNI
jgi:hypothetical protein